MQDKEPDEFRESASIYQIWLQFRKNRLALMSFYLFFLLILTALFAPLIAPYSESMQFVGQELMPPSWVEKGQIAFFFGTDDLARDVLSRVIIGTSYTLGSSLIVVILAAIIGGALGIWAGMSGGIKARFLGHIFDAFLSIPILLIAIIISTFMEPSLMNAVISTLLAVLPYFTHAIYRAIQQELKKEYVMMLKLDGISNSELLRSTILPNITVSYIQEISRAFVVTILDISALSFISLGAQRPTPEWGAMIKDSLELIYLAPWTVLLPGFAIIITILLSIVFTNGLCKAINQYYQ
ncbi:MULTISPECIES: ABC transporter permease subunit [unclassified Pasteurella]|uniref:ABC transporter permease subunit n=1 Tax=unclassified Pasteurella TaxID=2621516 RepID=UPI001074910E|nr:ABC transporter permease subunit [Pasteurella sp. 19428wF3_WM03]TFU51047.1 ABC transporter permease subunit [Pasteurella sp. WM03]